MSQEKIEIISSHLPRIVIFYGSEDFCGNFMTLYVFEKRFEHTDGRALHLDTQLGIWKEDIPNVKYVLDLLDQIPDKVIHTFRDVIFTRYLLETKHRQN